MNYIELLGISASGKTTLKKKLTKKSKKKIYDKKYIIINFYICNYKINLIHYLKSMSLLFLSSKISMKMKPKIRKTGIIFKSQKKTIFVNNKRNSMLKLLDYFGTDNYYSTILELLAKKLRLNKNNLFKIAMDEIKNLNQNTYFKKKLKRWFLENIVIYEIQRKHNQNFCINDEGLIQTLFVIFKFSRKKNTFINNVIRNFKQHGKLFILSYNPKKIMYRSKKRRKFKDGYIYKDLKEVYKEIHDFEIFKKYTKNKIKYVGF